jgi:hypothetical protein
MRQCDPKRYNATITDNQNGTFSVSIGYTQYVHGEGDKFGHFMEGFGPQPCPVSGSYEKGFGPTPITGNVYPSLEEAEKAIFRTVGPLKFSNTGGDKEQYRHYYQTAEPITITGQRSSLTDADIAKLTEWLKEYQAKQK